MRYDEQSSSFVVDDDCAFPCKFFINETFTYPPETFSHGMVLTQETRVVRGTFENRWSLSIIWGSMTYGSNYDHPHGGYDYRAKRKLDPPPFMEEPESVEVAIIQPEPWTREARTFGPFREGDKPVEFPEMQIEIWGDPLGYVDAPGLRFLIRLVSHFDSHSWRKVKEGPELVANSEGRLGLEVSYDDGGAELLFFDDTASLHRHAVASRDGLD